MNTTTIFSPNPQKVVINEQLYELIAFYYPDYDTPWDNLYQGKFLANFYPCKINLTIDGICGQFYTAEAAFQATKWWNNSEALAKFEQAETGTQAFHLSKSLSNPDYSYAGLGRDNAMNKVLTEKFSTPTFEKALLATGQAYLLEHNEVEGRDPYWSDNHNGSGSNMLGKTLMNIRKSYGGSDAPPGNYNIADFTSQVINKLDLA